MGGVKKKPITKAEKAQQAPVEETVVKKRKEVKPIQQVKMVGWGIPRLSDDQVTQMLGHLKAITIYGAAKALGVKASVATAVIKSLENRGVLKREGGYSGHYVYSLPSIKAAGGGVK